METNFLNHKIHTTVNFCGEKCKMVISVRLGGKFSKSNGHEDFAITADITQGKKEIAFGCLHDEILKVRPDLKLFVDLHHSDMNGCPWGTVENGFFYLKEQKYEYAKEFFRCNDKQFNEIKKAETKEHLAFIIEALKLPEQWKKEADEAIKWLEDKTGSTFKSEATKSHFITLTEEQKQNITEKVENGFFSEENKAARAKAKAEEQQKKEIEKVISERDKKINEATYKAEIAVQFLKIGVHPEKWIWYTHTNKIVFNWNASSYNRALTQEEFIDAINEVDKSNFPDGVEFEIKDPKTSV